MTGLDKILNEIRKESEDKVSRIISEATAEADKITAEAKQRADAEVKAINEKTEKQEKEILERAKSAGELSVRKTVLLKKHEIIGEIINKAKEKLITLPDAEYFGFLTKMLDKFAHGEKGTILMSKSDKERIPESFKKTLDEKRLTLSKDDMKESGGFILIYGDIEEKCTFDALFDGESERLTDTVMKTVFE